MPRAGVCHQNGKNGRHLQERTQATNTYFAASNEAGVAVGWAEKYNGAGEFIGGRAVRWDASGAVTELDGVVASAINNAGIIVGKRKIDSLLVTPVYWGLDGVAVDLNSLIDPTSGWQLWDATAISDTGWISGTGRFDPDGPGGQEDYSRMYFLQIPFPVLESGDYNGNAQVEQGDLDMVLLNWGTDGSQPPAGWINDLPEGSIDQDDLDDVLLNWGSRAAAGIYPPATVPEPCAAAMLLVVVLVATVVRCMP